MLDLYPLPAFIAAASLLTVSPGVDTAVVLRAAVGAGALAYRPILQRAQGRASGSPTNRPCPGVRTDFQ